MDKGRQPKDCQQSCFLEQAWDRFPFRLGIVSRPSPSLVGSTISGGCGGPLKSPGCRLPRVVLPWRWRPQNHRLHGSAVRPQADAGVRLSPQGAGSLGGAPLGAGALTILLLTDPLDVVLTDPLDVVLTVPACCFRFMLMYSVGHGVQLFFWGLVSAAQGAFGGASRSRTARRSTRACRASSAFTRGRNLQRSRLAGTSASTSTCEIYDVCRRQGCQCGAL